MTTLDQNRIPVMRAVLDSDGETIVELKIDVANNHSLMVEDNTTGSDNSTNINDLRDENRKVALWAVSSVDGVTPVQVYCDVDGKLLINSN